MLSSNSLIISFIEEKMLCAVRQNGKVDTVAVSVSSCSEYRNEEEDYPSSLLEEAKEGEDDARRKKNKRKNGRYDTVRENESETEKGE